ncbi:hypothetical protein ACP70R_021389 [Stipagrostis hirtigluma subsp. patula]
MCLPTDVSAAPPPTASPPKSQPFPLSPCHSLYRNHPEPPLPLRRPSRPHPRRAARAPVTPPDVSTAAPPSRSATPPPPVSSAVVGDPPLEPPPLSSAPLGQPPRRRRASGLSSPPLISLRRSPLPCRWLAPSRGTVLPQDPPRDPGAGSAYSAAGVVSLVLPPPAWSPWSCRSAAPASFSLVLVSDTAPRPCYRHPLRKASSKRSTALRPRSTRHGDPRRRLQRRVSLTSHPRQGCNIGCRNFYSHDSEEFHHYKKELCQWTIDSSSVSIPSELFSAM